MRYTDNEHNKVQAYMDAEYSLCKYCCESVNLIFDDYEAYECGSIY